MWRERPQASHSHPWPPPRPLTCLALTRIRYWLEDPANRERFPLFVSIDGSHGPTLLLAKALELAGGVQVIQNLQRADKCGNIRAGAYCLLSLHYKMVLQVGCCRLDRAKDTPCKGGCGSPRTAKCQAPGCAGCGARRGVTASMPNACLMLESSNQLASQGQAHWIA